MILRSLLRGYGTKLGFQVRSVSILKSLDSSPVLISSNKDVYTNLAIEHWLYTNLKFEDEAKAQDKQSDIILKKPIVFIWTDEPCVVMGRHQNPWIESTLGFIDRANLKLARRHSGGGCVYHDENNINISIIGHRRLFENRQANLSFIAQILNEKYNIKCETTKRHDIIHSETGSKISGSAAKLGRFNCYHHFTILVDTDKDALQTAIRQEQQAFIKTNSSISARSPVINLKELKADLEVDQVISDLADAYTKLYKVDSDQSTKKDRVEGDETESKSLNELKEDLQGWDWIYGMTPKFQLERSFPLVDGGIGKQVKFCVQVNKGLFEKIDIDQELGGNATESFKYLIGTKFTYKDAMVNLTKLLQVDEANILSSFGLDKLYATFLLQMVHESNY